MPSTNWCRPARAPRSDEARAASLVELEATGFLRRQRHPGNHVYLFPLTRAAKIAARTVPDLPYPRLDRSPAVDDVTALPLLALAA